MSNLAIDKDKALNYFLLADRFYEWCFTKDLTIAANDEEFPSLQGVLKSSMTLKAAIKEGIEVLFGLTLKYSQPSQIVIEDISSVYEKEKNEISLLISLIHGGNMFKSALFQRVTVKSPFKLKVKNLSKRRN